jgi:hypothetical protein
MITPLEIFYDGKYGILLSQNPENRKGLFCILQSIPDGR